MFRETKSEQIVKSAAIRCFVLRWEKGASVRRSAPRGHTCLGRVVLFRAIRVMQIGHRNQWVVASSDVTSTSQRIVERARWPIPWPSARFLLRSRVGLRESLEGSSVAGCM